MLLINFDELIDSIRYFLVSPDCPDRYHCIQIILLVVTHWSVLPVRLAVCYTAKLLDKSVASRLASRLVAKVCTYDINNFIRNLYTLSRILTCLSTSLSEDHPIDGRIHHQISDSSTTVSVHRSMSASGWCTKDNFNALLCIWDAYAVGSILQLCFGGFFTSSNVISIRQSTRQWNCVPTRYNGWPLER